MAAGRPSRRLKRIAVTLATALRFVLLSDNAATHSGALLTQHSPMCETHQPSQIGKFERAARAHPRTASTSAAEFGPSRRTRIATAGRHGEQVCAGGELPTRGRRFSCR